MGAPPMPRFPLACLLFLICAPLAGAGAVSLSQDSRVFRMGNGRLEVEIEKRSGRILSASLGGRNVLRGGSGYWSMAASSGRNRVSGFGNSERQSVAIDPVENQGSRAEVVCHFKGTGADGAFPGNVEVRYSIGRDDTVLHACAVLAHGAGDAAFHLGEARFLLKLDKERFDHLSIDRERDRDMPAGADWDAGEELNMKEVRRLKTGRFAGSVEHKYAYSAILADLPAYGWSGTKERLGVWIINPSCEYIAGGATKMELTGHLDVGDGGRPTLLNMWHGSHYGGTVLELARDEVWSKVIGPFAIYFNEGSEPAKLRYEAVQKAVREKRAWPYEWFRHALDIPAARRGGVAGRVRVESPFPDDQPRGLIRVGLTEPDYQVSAWRGPGETIGWQRDGKFYQYWTRASRDGSFRLTGVRPGGYVLRAFADGVWGEFAMADVTVREGGVAELGEIRWTPARTGPSLWQIGVPDRGAAEFRNGDRYWEWGNYLRFKKDFPRGVDYTVGASDWKKDWHLCQPLDLADDGTVLGASVWTVRFPLERVPEAGARLRVALCGSRAGARLSLELNGKSLGKSEALPENGVMHRDSYRGLWMERAYPVSAEMLREGGNTLKFRLDGGVWHHGVLYDCIRMEAAAAP